MKRNLIASIASRDYPTLFDQVSAWSEFHDALPFDVGLGHDTLPSSDWQLIKTASNPTGGIAIWDEYTKHISAHPRNNLVSFEIPGYFSHISDVLDRIMPLDFYLAELGSIFPDDWLVSNNYPRWGFGKEHIDHGWGCVFRGTGHDRLVSRRWLDFGPWRVVHLPNDTTFVQFHDLAIRDPLEVFEQAKHGHQRMGVDDIGGYIQGIYTDEFSELEYPVYHKDTYLLELVVAQRIEITQRNMWIACALRLHFRLTNEQENRVERIAYIFINRSDAEIHLHELWLRELECWYMDEHGKHRLDLDYHPTPRPPAWVAQLDANPVNALPSR